MQPAFQNMGNGISNFHNSVGGWFSEKTNSILNFFAGIPEFFSNFWQGLREFFIGIFVPEDDYFENIMADIKSSFATKIPYEDFKNIFEDIKVIEGSESGLDVNFSGYKIGNKTISTGNNWIKFDFILRHKNTWFAWCRGFTYIFFIIYNINQFIKFLGRLGVVDGGHIQTNNSTGKEEDKK